MRKPEYYILATLLVLMGFNASAQQEKIELDGYVKLMQTTSFGEGVDGTLWDYLLHNRMNLNFTFSKRFTGAAEFRNRLFAGNTVSDVDRFGELVDIDNGAVDMSWLVIDSDDIVGIIQADRLWMDYHDQQWNVRLGRQRINWGINLFWNNHDLFNTYSLVEFDYEERPGSDAIRVTRILGDEQWIELAVKYPANDTDGVAALRYAIPVNRYDMKFIGGIYGDDVMGGIGWEGNLGDAGFKGELAYFLPYTDEHNSQEVFTSSISFDYLFPSQLMLTAGYLYQDIVNDFTTADIVLARLGDGASPKQLMPFDHNLIMNLMYPFNPIVNGSVMATYSPGADASFLMGSMAFSVADNWEVGLFGQFFVYYDDQWNNPVNSVFLRIKYSF